MFGMSMSKKNFDEIINSVSINDLEESDNSESLKLNIALFARFIVKAHVFWDKFPKHLKCKFSKEIENLYNNPPMNNNDLLKAMEIILLRCLPDNHCFIKDSNGQKVLSQDEIHSIKDPVVDKYPQTHVGQNTVFSLQNDPDCNTLIRWENGKDAIGIFEKIENGQKIGIVSLSYCPQPNNSPNILKDFINTFESNLKNWDCIILDVRGNRGGNSAVIEQISNKLYGNDVVFCSSQSLRMTPEAKFLQNIKFSHPQNNKKLHNIYNHTKTPYYHSPYREETLFNAEKGFNKNVYIIIDRATSSSAEYVCGLYKHPKVKYIGENTCGCGEFGDVVHLRLPCGGILQMGVWKYNTHCNIQEGIGWTPTYSTPHGKDAFSHCLEIATRDFAETKGPTPSKVTYDKLSTMPSLTQHDHSRASTAKLCYARYRCNKNR